MKLKPLRKDIVAYLEKHHLVKKWAKASALFEEDMRHPSLHTELLEPKWHGLYSFRLDRRYRAVFIIVDGVAEIVVVTNHYKK